MVTVRLAGGLGNQMFQYAVGRALALRRSASLALDVSAFRDCHQRQYSLGAFRIVENLTSGGLMRFDRLRGLCGRVWIPGLPHVLIERGFAFDPSVLKAPGNVYLIGYWQSEKYFKEIEDIIRRDFSFKSELDPKNAEMAKKIEGVTSVCVHVRRGDYVSDPSINQVHGTCSPEYYWKAARLVASKVPNPHFFVFSDEPDWVRANLQIEGATTFVTQNGLETAYEDLRLMSLCQHHIIANSSFSWWGAWLSTRDGIVVAPKKWFNEGDLDVRDRYLDTWIRM